MAGRQRHLWIGDWQRYQEPAAVTKPPVAERPTRSAVATRKAQRRTRAWIVAAALGSAVFAWSFGYILGEVRSGTDPGVRARALAPAPGIRQQPQVQSPGQAVPSDPSQGLPPLTTRQS